MAEAFLQVLLEKLNLLIQKELGLIWGVDKEFEKLSSLLSTIQAVLEDAEEKQIKDRALQNWLQKLKDAAYKVDDILDECATEAARLESEGQNSSLINKVHTSFLNYLRPHNLFFYRKIGSRMRDIRERLDEIAEERLKFHLREGVTERQVEVAENRQTGSIITQSIVYGRDEDKERIVECLVETVAGFDEISVYPVVGLGGLGKTTLAQMVFNDDRVMRHFELRIWVCISENFNVRKIIKAIIESATRTACEALDLDPLQRRLQDILNGKRYLLVLDDVWNDDQEKWDRLKYVLACGSRGASVIVTTRIKRVALIMGTLPLHHLSGLREDDCWSLFSERAFGHENEERPNLVALGKKIVKKCGGVPLAVKSLGSLMRYKREENEWRSVVESELWNLPQDDNSILPALQLSYFNLPSTLKQCFAYCAVFPKDSIIKKEDLIQLWMANGFIPFTEKSDPEDIGNGMYNELCWRSFFQSVEESSLYYIEKFKMHDLVHDLAQSIMKDGCLITEDKSTADIPKRIFHVTVATDPKQSYFFSKALSQVKTLRTFLLKPIYGNSSEFFWDFSRLSSLRVFGPRQARMLKLSKSISRLKHLRYLDLSGSDIQMLPESICSLFNLQTLKLEDCSDLQVLPKHIKCLLNLRHLYLNGCFSLYKMPPNIGKITCLKTLTVFIVGKKRGCHLTELKGLNIGGELHIKHLERVASPVDAKEANLIGKQNLRSLYLSWRHDNESELQEDVEKILEALEPHPNLERLKIAGYKGNEFPLWMRDKTLNNVVIINLSNCENCSQLPPLGLLPSLKHLTVSGMITVLYIDHGLQSGMMIRFPSLESLTIRHMSNLQSLSRGDGREQLLCLANLKISGCPKLTLSCLPSLKQLSVDGCSEVMLRSISYLRSLNKLNVYGNDELSYFPEGVLQNLTSLHSLTIQNFNKLKEIPTELGSLNALKSLHIVKCHELEYFPEQGLEGLNHLQHLQLRDCRKFTSLSEGIRHLSSLEQLILDGCTELVALPEGIKHLSSLQELFISGRTLDAYVSSSGGCSIDFPKLEALPEALRHVPALQSLSIYSYPDLASLPHWLGELTSLRSLEICNCSKLSSLPASVQSLSKLQLLAIAQCPEMLMRCEKEKGEDWHKIAHVSNINVYCWPETEAHKTNRCIQLRSMCQF